MIVAPPAATLPPVGKLPAKAEANRKGVDIAVEASKSINRFWAAILGSGRFISKRSIGPLIIDRK